MWQNSKDWFVTKLKNQFVTKLENSNCDSSYCDISDHHAADSLSSEESAAAALIGCW